MLTSVVLGGALAAASMVRAQAAGSGGTLAVFSNHPMAALQVSLGIVFLSALIVLPLGRLIARAGLRRVVEIDPACVRIVDCGPFGTRSTDVPLSSYVGIARRMRTSLSSVHHEVVLLHADPRRNVVLGDAPAAAPAAAMLDKAAALLGLPEVDPRDIYRRQSVHRGLADAMRTDAPVRA